MKSSSLKHEKPRMSEMKNYLDAKLWVGICDEFGNRTRCCSDHRQAAEAVQRVGVAKLKLKVSPGAVL